mgnify:CR=1 FL=1
MIDARGLSCPQPVILAQRALSDKPANCEIIVDNGAAKENVTRFAQHAGYTVDTNDNNGEYTLSLTRKV